MNKWTLQNVKCSIRLASYSLRKRPLDSRLFCSALPPKKIFSTAIFLLQTAFIVDNIGQASSISKKKDKNLQKSENK